VHRRERPEKHHHHPITKTRIFRKKFPTHVRRLTHTDREVGVPTLVDLLDLLDNKKESTLAPLQMSTHLQKSKKLTRTHREVDAPTFVDLLYASIQKEGIDVSATVGNVHVSLKNQTLLRGLCRGQLSAEPRQGLFFCSRCTATCSCAAGCRAGCTRV
jgi:hypothetical protein